MISITQSNPAVEITAANDEFMQCFGQGNAAGVAALYTREGQLLPPNSDFVWGQEAIQAFMQIAMQNGVQGVQLESLEVEEHGDIAVEMGRYAFLGAEAQILDEGKYLVLWKQVSGQWKLHRDIFNSSRS